jgi:GNAT superfamily N-acetyltransferase
MIYRTTRCIDPARVRALFRRTAFNNWLSLGDVAWYLRHALFVATAWAGGACVGIAVLAGDGRISISVDLLLVDEALRRQGVGTRLMELAMKRIARLKPYHVSVEVFERGTERFYNRFGFVRNRGTWLLEHEVTAERLRRRVRRCRCAAQGRRTE